MKRKKKPSGITHNSRLIRRPIQRCFPLFLLPTFAAFCIGFIYPFLKGVYLSLTTIGFSEVVRIFITNLDDLTGDWVSAEQTTDPSYWARHAREPVRFADGIATLARGLSPILLEVGPGAALASFALQGAGAGRAAISCLPDAQGDAEASGVP